MSSLAQVLLMIVGVYGFVVGLLVLGSRGIVDAVIQHPADVAEPAREPALASAAPNVVSLRPEAWTPATAQPQPQAS